MKDAEKDLRVQIVHLREKLLLSENQFFYRIYHFFLRFHKQKDTPQVALKDSNHDNISFLLSYKLKLEKFDNSPFTLLVSIVNMVNMCIFFIPRYFAYARIRREFQSFGTRNSTLSDVINFGVMPYNFRKLRQQHLVEELARRHCRVFYIENRFGTRKNFLPGYSVYKHRENVYIIKLNAIRDIAIYHQKAGQKEVKGIFLSLKKLIKEANITRPIVKIDHPFWTYLLSYMKWPIIYDCMDDYEGFDITGKHIIALEKQLIKKSDLTLVCSRILMQKVKKSHPKKTLLLKNACEYDHFTKASSDYRQITSDQKVIGFFGAIGEWIDERLIEKIARHFPQTSILLIGEVQNDGVKIAALKYKNIVLVGEVQYKTLPEYLKKFDVCIIPFKITKHTTLIDPVKMYEYFASGKPVVSTAIKEIALYGDVLYYSSSHNDFIHNIKQALEEKNHGLSMKRQNIARQNTWSKRAKILRGEISKISNIVYNSKIAKQ